MAVAGEEGGVRGLRAQETSLGDPHGWPSLAGIPENVACAMLVRPCRRLVLLLRAGLDLFEELASAALEAQRAGGDYCVYLVRLDVTREGRGKPRAPAMPAFRLAVCARRVPGAASPARSLSPVYVLSTGRVGLREPDRAVLLDLIGIQGLVDVYFVQFDEGGASRSEVTGACIARVLDVGSRAVQRRVEALARLWEVREGVGAS